MKKGLPSNTFIFSLHAVMLVLAMSCGKQGDGTSNKSYTMNSIMSAVTNLTTEERAIATRVCYAYKSKSSNFRSQNYLGSTFVFNLQSKDCEDKKDNYALSALLQISPSGTLIFTPQPATTKQFQGVIQNSQTGFLVQLCNKIQTNQVISNTADDDTGKVQVSFFKDSLDGYRIQRYIASGTDNAFRITSAETFKVRTSASGTQQVLGMDEEYSKQATCASGTNYSDFNQKYVNLQK